MSLFKPKNTAKNSEVAAKSANEDYKNQLAFTALKEIHDGVVMTNKGGVVEFINPAAVAMTGCGTADNAYGLDYGLLIKIETKEGRELSEAENPLILAMKSGEILDGYECALISAKAEKKMPISISVVPVSTAPGGAIITFRDITKELAEEGEQTEFISTASHEMRTPVATIDGYLSLCLNPATATVDDRARGYLEAAHAASQHLGKLFRDLLDTTKLDDGRIRPTFVPVEMVGEVKKITDDFLPQMKNAGLNFQFGSTNAGQIQPGGLKLEQVVYASVDVNFLREIMDNLLENAVKYTPSGGSVYVGVRGDGDRVLINVTDTGIGISATDIQHVFQKFYRADNSDTREIGGTGLGLYITKQRVEAMGGRVWAESAFGEGSTFYVSLPRLTNAEYEKRMIAYRNAEAAKAAEVAQQNSVQVPQQNSSQTIAQPVQTVQSPPVQQMQSVQQPIQQIVQQQPVQQTLPLQAVQQVAPPQNMQTQVVQQPPAQPPISQSQAMPQINNQGGTQ